MQFVWQDAVVLMSYGLVTLAIAATTLKKRLD
jgi:hypothetical protein